MTISAGFTTLRSDPVKQDRFLIKTSYQTNTTYRCRSVCSGTVALLSALLLSTLVVTDTFAATIFGVKVGATVWNPDVDGSVGQNTNAFDLSGEFSDSNADSSTVYISVEHFLPLIPNGLLKRTPISWTGSSDSASGTLGGVIPLSGEIDAEIDLDMTDLTLYYEVLDNWVSIDVGATARLLDGFVAAQEVTVNNITTTPNANDRIDVNAVIPMLYGHARFDLPFSGLAAGVRANVIGFDGNNLSDLEAYVHLEVDFVPLLDFGIEGGFRRLSLDIDDLDDLNSDATIEGAFVGLTARF